MRKLLALLLALLLGIAPALAGTAQLSVTDSTSTTQKLDQTTDGSGNYVPWFVLCDYSAAANCATISAAHALLVQQGAAAASGPWITTPWIAGAVNSATNGTYANLLVGNVAVDSTHGVPVIIESGSLSSAANLNFSIVVTPTIQSAAYASGNGMGGFQTIAFFRSGSNFSGMLTHIQIEWSSTETTPIILYLFNKAIGSSTCGDKAAVSLLTADRNNLVMEPVVFTAAATVGTSDTSVGQSFNVSMQNHDTSPGQDLYLCVVAGGTFTPAGTTDLNIILSGVLD